MRKALQEINERSVFIKYEITFDGVYKKMTPRPVAILRGVLGGDFKGCPHVIPDFWLAPVWPTTVVCLIVRSS